jgi:hypothetical protein
MKEIKIIKLVSFLLFVIAISALLFILFATNHLVSYGQETFPYGIQKEQKFTCNESNDFCRNIPKTKVKLSECSLNKYKNVYRKNGVVINPNAHPVGMSTKAFLNFKKIENDQYDWEMILTDENNNQCIKFSKIYFLYKSFPKLENLYFYWQAKVDFGISKSVNPFIKGETSISNIVKRYPFNYIFKPLMYITSILMSIYWINYYIFFKKNNFHENNKFLIFGIMSSVLLFLHVFFLGTSYEIPNFQKIRRAIIASFILSEILAEFFLASKIYRLKLNLFKIMRQKIILTKMVFVCTLMAITVISLVYIILYDPTQAFNNILEWNYFCFLLFFYLLSSIIWKKKD